MIYAFILFIQSLIGSPVQMDSAQMSQLRSNYQNSTVNYDQSTGTVTVTNPNGGVIIINPEENN